VQAERETASGADAAEVVNIVRVADAIRISNGVRIVDTIRVVTDNAIRLGMTRTEN
jgi:hypothetical protein